MTLIHMRGNTMKKAVLFSTCLALLTFISPAFAELSATLQEGVAQYQKENYEEAIEVLSKVRLREPQSTQAAFFLGMAYKQVLDFPKAATNLRDAVTLTPPIKEALVELTDTLYQMDNLEEAKKWLATAEEIGVAPPRVAFLKGLICSKENKNLEAISAFERAKQLEPALTQSAEFQIGICFIKERQLEKAKARFQAVILQDPLSDLASFARQYHDLVEERMVLERPLHLTVSVFGAYDGNIVLKPLDTTSAGDITDETGMTLTSSVRLDYTPRMEGPWLFNAQYSIASTVNSVHTHSHDSLANNFSLSPGYNFGRFSLNLNASYTNVLLRTDPDLAPDPDSNPGYKRYLDFTSLGPVFRLFVNPANIVEFFVGYDVKNYYNQKVVSPDALRDTVGFREYVSWIWLFKENAFLNLRYDFANEHADGRQWTNDNHRLTFNVSYPLLEEERAKRFGPLNLQVTGSAFFQNYRYETNFGIITETRRDRVHTGSLGLAWKFWKYANLIGQYTKTQSKSNVPLFEYDRNQYSMGLEFRY